jgi:hypothetical protein
MAQKIKTDPVKTMLTIAVGFLVIYMVSKQDWALWVSLSVGLIGILSPYLSRQIDWLWMKLAWLLSFIVPNILLSLIFYLFLFPIALLAKLFGNKDPLQLKKQPTTAYKEVNKTFDKAGFEKPW